MRWYTAESLLQIRKPCFVHTLPLVSHFIAVTRWLNLTTVNMLGQERCVVVKMRVCLCLQRLSEQAALQQ